MESLEQIKKAVDLCNQRDVLKNQVEEYQEVVDMDLPTVSEYKKISFDSDAPKTLFLILSIVLGVVAGTFVVYLFNLPAIIGSISWIVLPFIFYHLVLKKLFHLTQRKDYEEYEGLLIEAEKERPEMLRLLNEMKRELEKHENFMRDENVCVIPENYWDNANFIYALIINKRAYDLVSAINKFEDIMHQMRMEAMAQESLEWQQISAYNSQIAAENAAIAAENSRRAATYSGISAVFSIANYIDNNS